MEMPLADYLIGIAALDYGAKAALDGLVNAILTNRMEPNEEMDNDWAFLSVLMGSNSEFERGIVVGAVVTVALQARGISATMTIAENARRIVEKGIDLYTGGPLEAR